MSRTVRASQAGFCYHVLNRGNARSEVFHKPEDFATFLQALNESSVRLPMQEILHRGDWNDFVNRPMTEVEVEAIRLSVRRGRPFGSLAWTQTTAEQLGLEFSLRSPGGQPKQTISQSP